MPTPWHVHVYFRDDRERTLALTLRSAIRDRFPSAHFGRIHEIAVAFHPAPMFQVALDRVPLGTLLPWLQRHREGLSLLVHPLTGDVVREHREDAIWLGVPLELHETRLRQAAAATMPNRPTSVAEGPSVLRIDASARRDGSRGRALADDLVRRLLDDRPGGTVVHRDLVDGVPLLDPDALAVRSTPAGDRTPAEADAASASDTLIAEVMAADAVVVSLPIYNFHVPASFKAWIDLVARPRVTFRYGPDGPRGLLADRPVYVIVTSGGTRLDGPVDFVTPWLRHVLGFLGLHDVHVIRADGLGSAPEARLAQARRAIARAALPFRRSA